MQSGSSPTQFVTRIACSLMCVALALSAQPANSASPPRLNPESILREWATASQAIVPAGKSAGKRTQHAQRSRHNGHQIAIIVEFRGPIVADKLLARYRFTKAKRTGNTIRLTAVPRDVVERLFIPRFEVGFTDDSILPTSLRFADRNSDKMGEPVAILIKLSDAIIAELNAPVRAPLPSDIQLVGGEQVKSQETVRTAAAEIPADNRKESAEVRRVLAKWKASVSQVRTFRAEFVRFRYDRVFNVERRSRGSLVYVAPNKWRLDVQPSEFKPGENSGRMDDSGKRYTLQSGRARETMIWTGKKVYRVSHESKQVEVFNKPIRKANVRKASFSFSFAGAFFDYARTHLPMFATWQPQMETEFTWSIANRTQSQLQLVGIPRTKQLKSHFAEIGILLDAKTFRVRAVKFVDPGKHAETVFLLKNVMVNVNGRRIEPPKRAGYKWIEHGK
jgi:hypothetical protein